MKSRSRQLQLRFDDAKDKCRERKEGDDKNSEEKQSNKTPPLHTALPPLGF